MTQRQLALKPATEAYWEAREASYDFSTPYFFSVAWKLSLATFDLVQTTEETIRFKQEMAPLLQAHRAYFIETIMALFNEWEPHPLTLEAITHTERKNPANSKLLQLYEQREQLSKKDLAQALLTICDEIIESYLSNQPKNVSLSESCPMFRLVSVNVPPNQTTILGGAIAPE